MSEYVPTTDNVRFAYVYADIGHDGEPVTPFLAAIREFDAWLNSIKADAWDEGFDAGEQDVFQHEQHDWLNACIVNPYRKEQSHE